MSQDGGSGSGRRRGEGLSRRALFDVFRKPLETLREELTEDGGGAASTRASLDPPSDPPPAPDYPRVVRPPDALVSASAAGPGVWDVDLGETPLPVGAGVVVTGAGLPENVVLVRVNGTHCGAVTAECPVDGSDLAWNAEWDRVVCPGCASAWRLDGCATSGPAHASGAGTLGHVVVECFADDAGALEVRLRA